MGCGGLGLFLCVFLGLGEGFFAFFNAFCTVSWFLTLKGVCFLFQTHSSRFESLVCVWLVSMCTLQSEKLSCTTFVSCSTSQKRYLHNSRHQNLTSFFCISLPSADENYCQEIYCWNYVLPKPGFNFSPETWVMASLEMSCVVYFLIALADHEMSYIEENT